MNPIFHTEWMKEKAWTALCPCWSDKKLFLQRMEGRSTFTPRWSVVEFLILIGAYSEKGVRYGKCKGTCIPASQHAYITTPPPHTHRLLGKFLTLDLRQVSKGAEQTINVDMKGVEHIHYIDNDHTLPTDIIHVAVLISQARELSYNVLTLCHVLWSKVQDQRWGPRKCSYILSGMEDNLSSTEDVRKTCSFLCWAGLMAGTHQV